MAKESPVANPEKDPSPKSKIYRRIVFSLWALFIAGLLGLTLYVYTVHINFLNLYGEMPDYVKLENPENDLSSELYSADNVLLGKYFRVNRVNATFDELSPNLVNSLIAVEDFRFYDHSGIDQRSLMRVAIKTILMGQNTGGGSTLSQQTAKNLFRLRIDEKYKGRFYGIFPKMDILFTKTKEWILAVRLERAYTKKEILAMYLNTLEFGGNAFGIKVATQTFFKKPPNDLEVHEAALMAGLVQNPTRHNPIRHPESALNRRNVVIGQLAKYNYLSLSAVDSFQQRPLDLHYRVENQNMGLAPYFRSVIKGFLYPWASEHGYNLDEDGLKIYTTIDSRMQKHAEEAVASKMAKLQKKFNEDWNHQNPWIDKNNTEIKGFLGKEMKKLDRYRKLIKKYGKGSDSVRIVLNTKRPMRVFSYKGEVDTLLSPIDSLRHYKRLLHTGFMAMDPFTGSIKAWVGGISHQHFKFDHVWQGKRQPGSTFKPFVYATAIENGYSPCYTVYDLPRTYSSDGSPDWSPNNSSGKFTGKPMTLREAMAGSVNSVTASIMHKVQPENVIALTRRMGIKSDLEPVLSLALGVSDVSLNELVGAYSTFVNKGVYTEPYYITRIEDKHGNVLYEPQPKTVEALSEETAYLMLHMLKGTTELASGSAKGLSPKLRNNMEIGAKTGTTQNGSDGWFMGVTSELVAGAWVGGDSRHIRFRNWSSGQGARTAMPIWEDFMLRVYSDPKLGLSKTTFDAPEAPLSIEIDCAKFTRTSVTPGSQKDSLNTASHTKVLDLEEIR